MNFKTRIVYSNCYGATQRHVLKVSCLKHNTAQ